MISSPSMASWFLSSFLKNAGAPGESLKWRGCHVTLSLQIWCHQLKGEKRWWKFRPVSWLKSMTMLELTIGRPWNESVFFTFHGQGDVTASISGVAGVRSWIIRAQIVDMKLMESPVPLQLILETCSDGRIVPDPGDWAGGIRNGAGKCGRFSF